MTKTSYEKIKQKIEELKLVSTFDCDFDIEIYKKFGKETDSLFPTGVPFLINNESDCQQCFYALQIDSYAEGCTHNCVYCWAKFTLSEVDKWNNPVPLPIDFSRLWEIFYKVFENDEFDPLYKILKKKIPIRIGSFSDPFLSFEKNLKVTRQIIKMLEHYNYPYLFVTRSSLVADDDYIKLMNPKNCAVQLSIPTLNESLTKALEPGASTAKNRLETLKKLTNFGFKVVVRINPLFPTHSDGYYSGSNPSTISTDFFDLEMIKTLHEFGARSLLVGFVHLKNVTMNEISKKINFDLASLMNEDLKRNGDFNYSSLEIRKYYEKIKHVCAQYDIKFSTCYLGLGEKYFWKDQDLWDNKNDCCDLKNELDTFKTTARDINYTDRLKIQEPKLNFVKRFTKAQIFKMKDYILKNSIDSGKD